MKSLLHENNHPPLPDHNSIQDLSNKFASFFDEKITAIRRNLPIVPPVEDECTVIPPEFDIFVPTTDDQLKNIITCAPVTTCSLDPLPGWVFKDTLDCTLPTITDIINRSLVSGIVPDGMKTALVRPLLKKPSLHQNVLKNYRPVSIYPTYQSCLNELWLHNLITT